MKKLLIFFLLILCMLNLYGEKKDLANFRKTKWGMSQVTVKGIEKQKLVNDKKGELVYSGSVASLECYIIYTFVKNKLIKGAYLFTVKHSTSTDYILDYDNLKELLIKKYGKPIEDKTYWINDLFRNDPQNYGVAIRAGHLTFLTKWENKHTTIIELLGGDNYEITLGIGYASVAFKDLDKKEAEKKDLKDL